MACQKSFDKVKNLLCLEPILTAPDFSKPFWLAVDGSDMGAGAVLLQSDDEDIEHNCLALCLDAP